MRNLETDIVILGAGLTGLTLAHLFIQSGRNVTLLEQESSVGGLAKTVEYKGFKFDLGGHRIFFHDENSLQYIKSILGEDRLIRHKRKSSIFLKNKFLKYPLDLTSGFSYGLSNIAKFIFENSPLFPKKRKDIASLKEWVCYHFGPRIHDMYFADYSQKVWGLSTEHLSAIWAEKRIGCFDSSKLIKDMFRRSKDIKENTSVFYYPSLGIGSICNALVQRLDSKIRLFLSADISRIDHEDKELKSLTYTHRGEYFNLRFRYLISTIPLVSLFGLIFPDQMQDKKILTNKICYRSLVLVYLILNQEKVFNEHWIYFPEKDIIFARASEPKNWSKNMAVDGKTAICLEIFCDYNDNMWNMSEDAIVEKVVDILIKLDFISRDKIIDYFVRKVPFAYPLFYLGYEQSLRSLLKAFSRWENLSLSGRNGIHSYYDIEECIEDAHRVVNDFFDKHSIDYFNTSFVPCEESLSSGI